MTRLRRLLLAALAIGALAGPLAGCGISADDEPAAIAPDNLPPDLLDPNPTSSTTLPPGETAPVTIYLVGESGDGPRLVAVRRAVPDPSSPGQRLAAVIDAQPDAEEQDEGLVNPIPEDVQLLEAPFDRETGELVVNLSADFFGFEGEAVINAFAQMVFTAAELDGVRSLSFQVAGEPIAATDGGGSQKSSVDTGDYRALRPE